MRVLGPQEYRISSGRTGEDSDKIATEMERIFGNPTVKTHGGNESIDSFNDRTAKALAAQQIERRGK